MDPIFERLKNIIVQQQTIIESISKKIDKLESLGGGGSSSGGTAGNATISDFQSGQEYERNTLVVDPNTETVYRVLVKYVSTDIESDINNGFLKLVGYESQVVTFNHNPTQTEIENLPDDTLVAVYSSTDTPYVPDIQ